MIDFLSQSGFLAYRADSLQLPVLQLRISLSYNLKLNEDNHNTALCLEIMHRVFWERHCFACSTHLHKNLTRMVEVQQSQ